MNKPLTKEQWKSVNRTMAALNISKGNPELREAFVAVLDAMHYWREAAKNARHTRGDASDICSFTRQHVRMCRHLNCPWKLAQEESI